MDIVEAPLSEELMDGEHHGVAQAHHGPEGVGAEAQVGDVAKELQGVLLGLQRVFVGVGRTEQPDFLHAEFHGLTATHRSDQDALGPQRRAGVHEGKILFGNHVQVDDQLQVVDGGAVVQGDEGHVFAAALVAHPAHYSNLIVRGLHLQGLLDFYSFHCMEFFYYA